MKRFWLVNLRKSIYVLTGIIAVVIFLYIHLTVTSSRLEIIRLTQWYALYSTFLLYIALIASPLYSAFPKLPSRVWHINARKAIGNSAFVFALLHGTIAFFFQLGGFAGLFFLTDKYLTAITLSFSALVILCFMFITSFAFFITRLGIYWKPLHRLVYLACLFILLHALMLGTHFADLSGLIPKIFIYAITILLLLEALRFDKYLNKNTRAPRYFIFGICAVVILFLACWLLIRPTQPFYIHPSH